MPAASVASTDAGVLRARAIARDGWLFLGLGLAAPLIALTAAYAAESNETISFLGVALAACGVMSGIGLYKLCVARRAGLRTAVTLLGSIAFWLYAIVALFAICGFFMPRYLDRYVHDQLTLVSWTLPTLLIAMAVVRIALKKTDEDAALVTARRGACAIALSFLFIFYIFGMLGATNGHWLVRGGLLYSRYRDSFWQPEHAAIGAAIAFAWVLSLGSYLYTLNALNALRKHPAGVGDSGWLLLASWLYLVPMLIAACCFFILDPSVYGGAIGAVLACAVAGLLGALIGRVWGPGCARLRWWSATLPIAVVLLLVMPMTISIGLSGLTVFDDYGYGYKEKPARLPTWMLAYPEFVRAPLMRQLANISYSYRYYVYASGMAGIQDLKAECTSKTPVLHAWFMANVWQAWWMRDPHGALTEALAIPAASGSTGVPSTSYDYAAGVLIGTRGVDSDVVARLQGNYSDPFVSGILNGLEQHRINRFSGDFVKAFESRNFDYFAWIAFARALPDEAAAVIRERFKLIDSPAPVNSFWPMLNAAQFTSAWTDVLCAALKSKFPANRSMGLNECQNTRAPEVVRCLISVAQGALLGSTSNEQGIAAGRLHEIVDPRGPPAVDPEGIARVCKKAKEYLKRVNAP